MTAIAQTLPASPVLAAVREHWRAAMLVAAMLALWAFAGISLALHGGGPGFDSPQSRAGLPRRRPSACAGRPRR
jgi:hypothetical protein